MKGIEEETFPPKYKRWFCPTCQKRFLTVELALGKTPQMMTCLRTLNCHGIAIPNGEGVAFGIPLVMEFVKPDAEAMEKAKNVMPALYGYFRAGGLMRKAVDTAPDWVKDLA